MNFSRIISAATASVLVAAAGTAQADGGTIVLNTYSKMLPKMVGDGTGPTTTDPNTGATVPLVERCTGVGFMDPQLKVDDSPAAKAAYGTQVSLLITATRTDDQPANGAGKTAGQGGGSYMQGTFSVVTLAKSGPQTDAMKKVDLPRLDGERTWMKPNIQATDKYYLLVAASEDNEDLALRTGNPQVVAFVYDKQTLQPVPITNSNRTSSTTKPTNLIQLSGKNDLQQYGPHSIARVQGTDNAFVLGVQRDNANAYVMRVDVVDQGASGVRLDVKYLNMVVQNARHCRPDVTTNAADGTTAFLTSVEGETQPANVGVRALSFDVETGEVKASEIVAASDLLGRKFAVQPTIADLGKFLGISYQESEAAGRGGKAGTLGDVRLLTGNGHTGGSNVSMLALVDKATLKVVGTPMAAIAPYARHASGVGTMWGEDGKEMPALVSLGGSATGTGKGLAQLIPVDVGASRFGAKDPQRLYEVSTYSDLAGTVVRGKRNPENQGRGFMYATGSVPNPGYGDKTAFMPEVKTFIAAAVQGYSGPDAVKLAARESVYLSLIPASWVAGQPTTPGTVTDHPGTNPDGTGPLPRRGGDGPTTSTTPSTPSATGPDADAGANGANGNGGLGGLRGPDSSGCALSSSRAGGSAAPHECLVLATLGLLFGLRRKRNEQEGN